MWFFRGQAPNSYVYHNWRGYYYHCSYVLRSSAYFKCRSYAAGCRARAIMYDSGEFIESGFHSHNRNMNLPEVMALRQNILATTRRFPTMTFRQIVQQEGRRFPLQIRAEVNVNNMSQAMRRVRMERYPPQMPHTMLELQNILESDAYSFLSATEGGEDNMYASTVVDSEGNIHIILISRRMRTVMENCRWLFFDGHFASRPATPPMAQLYNISTSWDHHAIYLGTVLMTSRREPAYTSVFRGLRQLMPNLNPERSSCDYERAQLLSISHELPNCDIVGCLWHFGRAVVKKARRCGLGTWLLNSSRFRRHLRMCCCLALFPPELSPLALFEIGLDCLASGWFVYEKMYPVLEYLQTYWLNDPLRREAMSVYNSEHRTNNISECLNRYLRGEVGVQHPNVYAFLESLSRMESYSFTAITALANGVNPTRVRRSTALWNDARIQALARTLEDQPLGLRHAIGVFLWCGNNTFRHAFNELIGFDEEEEL